jgi:4'-phosphopantetheinyl transferase
MTSEPERWVHLYEFGVGHQPDAGAWGALSEEELARAVQIVDPARRSRFVARRAALGAILATYAGCSVCFNSSDSGDVAVVAVAGRPVGVDIEIDMPRPRAARVAERMFAADERTALDALRGDARRRLFHRCWVAKEAYAKGRGRGLAMRFAEFSVAPALCSPEGTGAVGEGWMVSVSTNGDRHLAVAAEGDDWEVVRVD